MITNTDASTQSIDINDEYQIYTQLCTPSTLKNGSDVVFDVHGYVNHRVSFKIYLIINHFSESGLTIHTGTLEENGSENNYVESVIAAGRSLLVYDALGQSTVL